MHSQTIQGSKDTGTMTSIIQGLEPVRTMLQTLKGRVLLNFAGSDKNTAHRLADLIGSDTRKYILNISSKGLHCACGLDIEAAQKLGADSVVHFGHQCHEPAAPPLPVVYADLAEPDTLNYDVLLPLITDASLRKILVATPLAPAPAFIAACREKDYTLFHNAACIHQAASPVKTVHFTSHASPHFEQFLRARDDQKYLVLMGQKNRLYMLLFHAHELMHYEAAKAIYSYVSNSQTTSTVVARLCVVQKCQKMRRAGFLVMGALGVDVQIDHFAEACRSAGFACTFFMLHNALTEEKLGNFPQVQFFVVLGLCSAAVYSVVQACASWHVPVLMPFECDLVLRNDCAFGDYCCNLAV